MSRSTFTSAFFLALVGSAFLLSGCSNPPADADGESGGGGGGEAKVVVDNGEPELQEAIVFIGTTPMKTFAERAGKDVTDYAIGLVKRRGILANVTDASVIDSLEANKPLTLPWLTKNLKIRKIDDETIGVGIMATPMFQKDAADVVDAIVGSFAEFEIERTENQVNDLQDKLREKMMETTDEEEKKKLEERLKFLKSEAFNEMPEIKKYAVDDNEAEAESK